MNIYENDINQKQDDTSLFDQIMNMHDGELDLDEKALSLENRAYILN